MSRSPSAPVKIGLLDSGVGGLSVLREVHRILPGAELHYVGDSAWCPYGTKSPEVICARVFEISDYLLSQGAGILVIACNSATIHAVGALRATYPLPVVGMEPAVKPAAELTRSGVIGVLATEASIAGEKFHQLVNTHASGVRVITRPCPRFVELVEAGQLTGPEVEDAVDEALAPLLEAGADVFVLGCTHYPFLRAVIEARLPDTATVVDTGPAVARRVKSLLEPDFCSQGKGSILVETTGALDALERLLPRLLPGVNVSSGRRDIRE
ncbi:MAG: glutamate racemase [Verrucomicrobiales bacterium]|nr:glutamate racemase [Verrucomicrobiales bacterium]